MNPEGKYNHKDSNIWIFPRKNKHGICTELEQLRDEFYVATSQFLRAKEIPLADKQIAHPYPNGNYRVPPFSTLSHPYLYRHQEERIFQNKIYNIRKRHDTDPEVVIIGNPISIFVIAWMYFEMMVVFTLPVLGAALFLLIYLPIYNFFGGRRARYFYRRTLVCIEGIRRSWVMMEYPSGRKIPPWRYATPRFVRYTGEDYEPWELIPDITTSHTKLEYPLRWQRWFRRYEWDLRIKGPLAYGDKWVFKMLRRKVLKEKSFFVPTVKYKWGQAVTPESSGTNTSSESPPVELKSESEARVMAAAILSKPYRRNYAAQKEFDHRRRNAEISRYDNEAKAQMAWEKRYANKKRKKNKIKQLREEAIIAKRKKKLEKLVKNAKKKSYEMLKLQPVKLSLEERETPSQEPPPVEQKSAVQKVKKIEVKSPPKIASKRGYMESLRQEQDLKRTPSEIRNRKPVAYVHQYDPIPTRLSFTEEAEGIKLPKITATKIVLKRIQESIKAEHLLARPSIYIGRHQSLLPSALQIPRPSLLPSAHPSLHQITHPSIHPVEHSTVDSITHPSAHPSTHSSVLQVTLPTVHPGKMASVTPSVHPSVISVKSFPSKTLSSKSMRNYKSTAVKDVSQQSTGPNPKNLIQQHNHTESISTPSTRTHGQLGNIPVHSTSLIKPPKLASTSVKRNSSKSPSKHTK